MLVPRVVRWLLKTLLGLVLIPGQHEVSDKA
jgi:hypothetical protein